jgi:hypothetical protein
MFPNFDDQSIASQGEGAIWLLGCLAGFPREPSRQKFTKECLWEVRVRLKIADTSLLS